MEEVNFGYREVTPDQTLPEKWKEITLNTGGTQSTLQDIKVAENAGGFSYRDVSNPFTRNRFIYWRICQDVLELVEHSLDVNLNDCRLRYRFTDTPILDGVSIHETRGQVIILVPTVCSVHYLIFTHPNRIHNRKEQDVLYMHPELTSPSIFTEASQLQAKDPSSFHIINNIASTSGTLPHTAASTLNKNNEGVFIFAYNSGSIISIRMMYGSTQYVVTEFKEESFVPRILSGLAGAFRSNKSNDSCVTVSAILHCADSDTFCLGLGRDGYLRAWSCTTGLCVGTTYVLADTSDSRAEISHGSQNHILRKASNSYDRQLTIGVFLCFASKCQFHILNANFVKENIVFNRLSALYAPEQDLVDFSLDGRRLWAVWRGPHGECTVNESNLDCSDGALWMPAVLEPAPPRDYTPTDPNLDPRQAYCDFIFSPGKFPFSVITKALNIYRRSATGTDISTSRAFLKPAVCTAVEMEIQAEVMEYDLSDDDYLEIANRCWARFYSCCAQYNATETRPLGILLLPEVSGLVLLKKSTISLLRPMAVLEYLVLCIDHVRAYDLSLTHKISSDVVVCEDLLILMSILVSLEQYLTDEIKSSIEREMKCLRSPDKVIADLVEELASESCNDMLPTTTIWSICQKTEKISDLYNVMHLLLESLRLDKCLEENDMVETTEAELMKMYVQINNLFTSSLGVSVVTETVHQMSVIRFSLCRNLLLLQQVLLQQQLKEWSVLESIRTICMPDTVVFTQAYYTIVWLCESATSPVTLLDSHQQRLTSLKLIPVVNSSRLSSKRLSKLPELFIISGGGRQTYLELAKIYPELDQLYHWQNSLTFYALLTTKLLWPVSGSLLLGEWLLSSGQYIILQQYVRQLNSWCEWNKCSRKFLLAVAYLTEGERRKALHLFLQAADGVHTEQFLIERIVGSTENSASTNPLIDYYLKVIHLFEQHGAFDCAISVAETAIERAQPTENHLATLYSIIFIHHLTLGHYNEAYRALEDNPDRYRRKDCLRQLVGTLLEKRALDVLMSFSYDSMLRDFGTIVEARARAINLQDNYIYDFLYAFYIKKENTRRASMIMYEQALMLSQINQVWALERQVKSLLSCLNALSLVDPEYQFIIRPKAFIDNQPVTEALENTDLLEEEIAKMECPTNVISENHNGAFKITNFKLDELDKDIVLKRDIEVLSLNDIKKELEMAIARLKITKTNPDANISNNSTPNELIGLLINIGMFENAINMCKIFEISYEQIFEALTLVCIRISQMETPEAWSWLIENNISDIALGCKNPADICWKLLEKNLFKLEQGLLTTLHKSVAKRIISMGYFLPHWLTKSYKQRNAGELIRIFMSYARLEEAYELSAEYLNSALGKGYEDFGLSHPMLPNRPGLCLPLNTFNTLLILLKCAGEKDSEYVELFKDFKKIVDNYIQTAERVTEGIEIYQWNTANNRKNTEEIITDV